MSDHLKHLKDELEAAETELDQRRIEAEKLIASALRRVQKARGELLDGMAAQYGVTRGEKRLFSSALERVLRQPHRQFTEGQIDTYRKGFIVETYCIRGGDKIVVGISTLDRTYGVGGIPIEIVAACAKITDQVTE